LQKRKKKHHLYSAICHAKPSWTACEFPWTNLEGWLTFVPYISSFSDLLKPMTKEQRDPVDLKKELSYIQKVWRTAAIVVLVVCAVLMMHLAFNVLLMVLAGSLIAIYFHGLGDLLQRTLRMPRKYAVALSVGGTFLLLLLILWFMGEKVQVQIAELTNTLPTTVDAAKNQLNSSLLGKKLMDNFTGDNAPNLTHTLQTFFSSSFGMLGDLYVIIFLAIFFTASPGLYKNWIMLLIPKPGKAIGSHIMDRITVSLKGWLKSMIISIIAISMFIAAGLSIVSIPLALVLGLIAGLLKLVPNFGALLAMIPGVLIGLTISPETAIIVAAIYIVSQSIVGNVITPLVQKKMINLLPALTFISQILMGSFSGALGIILAVPLLAILDILVDEFYVKKIN
jgi:predicted PurR-regulated permease PerM